MVSALPLKLFHCYLQYYRNQIGKYCWTSVLWKSWLKYPGDILESAFVRLPKEVASCKQYFACRILGLFDYSLYSACLLSTKKIMFTKSYFQSTFCLCSNWNRTTGCFSSIKPLKAISMGYAIAVLQSIENNLWSCDFSTPRYPRALRWLLKLVPYCPECSYEWDNKFHSIFVLSQATF